MTTDPPVQSEAFRVMTFTPSKEEFKDFVRYVAYMESQGAHRAGIAKVIPPKGWKPRRTYDDVDDLLIPAPIQQVVTGQSGLFTQYNIQKKPMLVHEFQKTSNLDKFCSPRFVDFNELEKKFWKNLTFNPPLYGADISGTLFDPDVPDWNISHLDSILNALEGKCDDKIKAAQGPLIDFGMWKSAFAWHTEEMDLYRLSYMHYGEPRSWYVVPPEHGRRLEKLAKGFFPGNAQNCEAFLRHKMTLISPTILKKYNIPFEKVIQEAGQFIVTFPFAYHAGFNHGFNCAESTNFATERWIEYGKRATLCSCRQDSVKISMDAFVHKYQPERYSLWKAGKDHVLIDHSKPTPEAAEFQRKADVQPLKESLSKSLKAEGRRRQNEAKKTSESGAVKSQLTEKKTEGAESDKSDLMDEENPAKISVPQDTEAAELEATKEKGSKQQLQSKVQSKSSSKKGVNRRSPAKKEKNGETATDVSPHRPPATKLVSPNSKETGHSMDSPGETQLSPAGLFQRPLSSADVLHVHSYAKGDYGDEVPPKEEENDGRDFKKAEDFGPSSKVSLCLQVMEVSMTGDQEPEKVQVQLPNHEPPPQDCTSDEEGADELSTSEEFGLEVENWAKALAHLWQNRPTNLKKEKEYNQRMGCKPPYCSICALFHTYQQMEYKRANAPVMGAGGHMRTKPLIPEMCFITTTEEDSEQQEESVAPYLEEDGSSLLISCSQCCVRVHTSCYGVDPTTVTKEWKCARCKANAMTEDCCLCWLRGGALQRTSNHKWVHVLCAVAVLEARFVSISDRSPVDLSGIPLQRFKLKCYYCKKRMKKASGCCVQCSHGRCPTAYHPTCAQAGGVLMQPGEWPFVVHVTCCRHKGPAQIEVETYRRFFCPSSLSSSVTTSLCVSQRNKAAMHELSVGQKVICKHKNGRYYQCDVVQLSKETFYEVNFDDGSFSDNLFPEDIVSRDCAQLGPPPSGEVVQVRWTDGLVYGAKFVAAHITQMYLVEFEDGSQLTAKRDDVYTLDEELPKRVKSRLSKASDMRFDGIFEEKEIIRESKRQRVINSRYRGDYIEPVIYRAIME
ncbi:lysine-specific demethylase 4A isoform X3 [Oryzias latipes]|uniref:lysine-specific demethylase 4A isoform X3 n=1 Tax=Oryzias latipes TaxID=8090 RepID=UPI000CE1F0A1|nr:lysine-specific demethylase 4A isoform X3 [Oryzias latipes]